MAELVTVKRANVILEIKADQVDRFTAQGYDILDDKGNVVKQSVPTDVNALRKAFVEHTETIKQLEARIKELQAKKKPVEREAPSKEAVLPKKKSSKKR